MVKQVSVKDGSKPIKVSGLVNGKLYSVSASLYRNITINKKGTKKDIAFYSSESGRTLFMPMSVPFNAYVSYPAVVNPTYATVNCTADSGVTGIRIYYRKSNTTDNWTLGCTTANGKFSCDVQNTGRGYDFRVQKYKNLSGKMYYGPSVVIKGR